MNITDDDVSEVKVSFGAVAYPVAEGGTVDVTVTLDADPERSVVIPIRLPSRMERPLPTTPTCLRKSHQRWRNGKELHVRRHPGRYRRRRESVVLNFDSPLPAGVSEGNVAETTVVIADDDTAGVTISETSLEIEEGDSDTYTVVLDSEPAGDVTVTIEGVTGTDVSLNKTTLTFTSGNWDTAQDVSVTAEQDDDAVDEEVVTIKHTVSSSGDTKYDGLAADNLPVTVTDDDTVGVTISETSLEIEEGDFDTYTVILDTEPIGDVVVTIDGIAGTDLTLDKTTLTFTTGNWDTAQTVKVTAGQDDDAIDEAVVNVTHTVSSTADSDYDSVTAGSVAVTVTDDDTAGVTVSETSLEIEEGDFDTYTVVLDTEPAGNVTVTIGGIADAELTLDKTTLTFTTTNWDTAQTVRVTAEQDDDAVDEEEVTITHTVSSTADTQYDGVTAGSVAITVTDDEVASPDFTLTMEPPTHGDTDVDGTVNLGDTLRYTAVATNTGNVPLENVNVKDALINTSGTDCVSLPIGATCTSTVTYTIVQADVDAGSVTNTATATADGVADKTVTRETAVDQVEDLELEKTTTTDGFAGTGESIPYTYKVTNTGTVTLSGTLEIDDDKIESGNITCPAVPGGGLAPGAFLTCTGSYTTVQADVDAGKVTNEATASLGGVTSGSDSVTVNWQAPQGNQPQLTVGSGEDDEDAGSFTFTVTLNPSSLQTVTVDYATGGGTATSGSDYTATSGSLTFSPGDITKNVTVMIADDDLDESDETFNLTLSDAVNASAPIPTGTFTIRDDDTAGVTVSDTSLEIDEGYSDTYTVVLDSQPTHNVTITVNDPSNTDVTADPADLTFTPTNWDTAQTVTVTASQDGGHDDEDGTVTHTAASTDTKYDGISVGNVLVEVTDDDDVPVTVSFGSATYNVAEGNSVAVKVKLSADPERTVEVPITVTTVDGAGASDYSNVPANVVFNSGDTEKTFDFEATQDAVDDDGERVRLTFGTLPPRVTSTSPSQAVVSITDDDVPSVTVSFEQPSYAVAEGSSVAVKVILSAQPERAVDIPVSATYLGGVGSLDFLGAPTTLNFGANDTEKTINFSAIDDSLDDDGEKVRLSFGNLPTQVNPGSISQATVSINDNDHPAVTVSFGSASYTVSESDDSSTPNTTENEVSVTIKLSADPERTVTIPITATGQGGADASDYSVPTSVVFNTGDTEKQVTFQATPDDVDDDGESVKLGFGPSLPARITAGTPAETTVSITDDDVPSITASFEQPSYIVAEGSSVAVKVILSADPERTVEVPLLKVNQGGASAQDYSNVPGNVVFNSGDTEKTFTFTAASDNVDDDGESVRVSFGTLPDQVSAGTYSGTTVSITDDDVPSVTVSFEQSSYTVAEGSSETVKVKLSTDPERTVTVPITKTNQGGATASDYNVPTSVVFNSGDTEKTFDFEATDDAVDDDGESVKLGFGSSLPTGVTVGSTDETTISITDDDAPAVTVSFEQDSYAVAEGSSVTVKVKLSADPERTVTIPLTKTNQGSASSSDYSNVPGSVVFNSGETEKTFEFTATDDSVDDDGESVKLGFQNLPTRVSAGTTNETTVSITDDDVPAVTVSFQQSSYTVAEGNSETVKVVLSADPERTVEVPISVTDMDGASSSDYSVVPTSVVFNSGDTEKTFTFSATDDAEDDDGERVRLNFGALPPRVSSTSPSQAVVSITDDDVPSVTVSFEQTAYTVAEGSSETVKVVLSADPERTVTIPLTKTNQGGASASDYSVPNSVVFDSGDTEKTFDFEATDDAADDDGESVRLGFQNLPTGVSVGTIDETTVSITDDDVPSVTVSFEQSSYTVAEGSSETVKVILSADPERTVTIAITKTNQGGASNSDYSNVPGSVVFNSGDTEKTFAFEATDDAVDDDGESVKLGFQNLPTGVSAGIPGETTVSITDDDVPSVTVSFEQAAYTVAEGSSETVKVILSADPERTVTIPITKTNQGGTSSSDYNVPNSVVFDSGDTEKTFSFSATQDTVDDDGESVKLGFGSSLPTRVTAGTPSETTVSITDDDVPSVTVSFEQSSYTVAEGSSETVKVILSADPERTVTIPLTATGQGGVTASDYNVPNSVVFNSGDTEKTFSFSATQDTVDDDGESVKLAFGSSLPTRVSAGTPAETTVSITDDDVPSVTVSFEQPSYTVAEGESVTVKVKLSADPERTVTIPLTKTNQGGASNSDYNVPANVVFNSGDTEKTFDFEATQDAADDDDESVKLGFGSSLPAGVTVGATNETTVSITDDDVPSVTVSFEQSSYTVAEGDSETVKVKLSTDPERTVEVPISATDMDGASSSDYSIVPQTVVFNSGDTEQTFSFSATDDAEDDDGERVRLNFGALPPRVSSTSPSQAVVSITDDDVPSVTVSFEQDSYTVPEGNTVTIKVVLSANPERTVTIPLTKSNQGGASSADYSVPNSVEFSSGDTEKTFEFEATDDTVDDDGESVEVGFGNSLPTGVTVGSTDETTVSITDDDHPQVTVSFGAASYTVAESDDSSTTNIAENEVSVTIKLSADPERAVTIPITATAQGGATSSDYSVPSSVVFNTGDTEKQITFQATPDDVDDDGESVKLVFGSSLPARITAGTPSETTVSITDDDVPSVTASFEQDSYTVGEGGSVAVKVTLSADPERTVTIPLLRVNQGGASASDYSVPNSVVFNAGDTEKEIAFQASQDSVDDDGESVRVSFGNLPDQVSAGTYSGTTVSITDDDVPSVTVSFEQTAYTVAEGSSEAVKVKLSTDPERTVTIPITSTGQGGATASDYSVPNNVVFNSGDTEKTFSFSATQDTVDDDGESVKLGFQNLPTGVSAGSTDETTVSITDDDVPAVTVSFEQGNYTVAEGSSETVKVKLSADPERTVTIPLIKTNQGGASNSDYSNVPGNIVFNSGDTEKTFNFSATQDTVDDDGESVKLGFQNLPTGVSAGTIDETTISITDDDVPSVTVSFEQSSYTVAEGSSETVKVKLSADPERTVEVPISATDMDGASSSDYSIVPQTVVFNSGDTEKTFSFSATDDTEDDDGERVRLNFGALPPKVSSTSPSQAVVSITDDDVPSVTVSFEQAAYTVAEGSSETVKVKLNADPERTVTIPITKTNQGGASNSDYSGVPANVVFNSGDTEKTFSFSATQDTVDDDGESVKLGFQNLPTGVSAGSADETTVSITDDDVPSVTVSFEQASYTVAEGSSETVKVVLSGDPERTVTIPITTTNQGGASSSDYSNVPGSVVFNSGDTEKTFDFEATDDTANDDGESVKLGFGNSLPTGVAKGSTDETTVSITDDDVPSVTVSFGSATHSVIEGESATITVTLNADPERTVTIPITATNQDGTSDSDYSGVPANVVFNSGDTEKTFDFEATDDDEEDDDESVKLTFGGLPTGVTEGTTNETVLSIIDTDGGREGTDKVIPVGDVTEVVVNFEQASYAVPEGSSVTVKLTLDQDPGRTVAIPLSTTDQGGASSADYSGVPASVEFVSGDTEKTFSFSATQDTTDDDGESVKVGFGDLPEGVSEGTTNETTISITDDDVPSVTVSFKQASYTAMEGSSTVVKVTLSADPERNVSVPLTTTNGTGTTSGDYSGVPASVDFASGDTEKSFTFTSEQDDIDENDEEVTLGFDTLPSGVSTGTTAQTTVTIVDSVHVSFGASSYEAYEGGAGAQVIVKLDGPAPLEIVIPITAVGMNGATSADWTGVPSNVTFASGDTQKSFIVMAYDDTVEDDGESVELGFGALPAGVARGTPSVATVELMNMETPTCGTAVWCATAEFADSGSDDWSRPGLGLGYHTTQEPYLRYSSLSDNRFTFRGKEYQVWSMFTSPGTHPDVSPGSPGRIPEYSTFSIRLMEVVGGELQMRVDQDHQRDWTLYIDGIALPFTDVVSMTSSGSGFVWHHPKLQDLYANWTDGSTYEIMIVEDPVSERPDPPVTMPMAPRYLRVIPGDGSLVANWKQPLKDGNSDITHYRLQWKLDTESWSNPNAIEEVTVQPSGGGVTEVFHMITGLSNYTLYSLRVIAVNGVGDSDPSAEHFGMPQEESLHIADTVVNGNQLTITYERTLDDSSIPSQESFWALVNGAPRNITGVSISGRSVILTLEEPAKRAIRATDVVEFRYVTPPSGAPSVKDTAGNYAYSCEFGEPPSEARNETDPGLLEPVSAEFTMAPESHDGPGTEVVFQIEFSEPVRVDIGRNYAYLLEVEEGKVTSAWWLDRDTTIWEIVVEPASNDDVRITLPAGRSCGAPGAPCGSGERRLSNQPEHTISGSNSGNTRFNRSPTPNLRAKPVNASATGAPGIEGSPVVGQTLTATTSGIDDDDGLATSVFAYQWLADDVEIDGATASTYTVAAGDEGKALRVKVTFTDDAGNEESLTSKATGQVAAALSPLTVSLQNFPASHNGTDVFTFEIRFSEHFALSYRTLRDHAFMVDGGTVMKAQRKQKGSNIGWTITVLPDSDADVTVVLAAATDCDDQGAICTRDGRKLSNSLEFTVSGP